MQMGLQPIFPINEPNNELKLLVGISGWIALFVNAP